MNNKTSRSAVGTDTATVESNVVKALALTEVTMLMAALVSIFLFVDRTRIHALSGMVIVLIAVTVYFLRRGVAGGAARNFE